MRNGIRLQAISLGPQTACDYRVDNGAELNVIELSSLREMVHSPNTIMEKIDALNSIELTPMQQDPKRSLGTVPMTLTLGPIDKAITVHVVPPEYGVTGLIIGHQTALDVGLERPHTPLVLDVSSDSSPGRPSDWDDIPDLTSSSSSDWEPEPSLPSTGDRRDLQSPSELHSYEQWPAR